MRGGDILIILESFILFNVGNLWFFLNV